ncbi:CB1 cannabinoid receptor-interacting protein 1 [Sorex araneus]|uniref:CB1 cannabinoid receptor-interacting protein 1 n=1 Tax=Sorex araneus TaxID=42254 RepID=UPI0024338186|nr:CB1 cannabinoid receptor-interacting protein 1 [Sorex araneus]
MGSSFPPHPKQRSRRRRTEPSCSHAGGSSPHVQTGLMHEGTGRGTQFTDIGTFETVWQVKFYNYHKRDHCQWGSAFSVIEYECKPNETRSLMWVNKESFL